MTDNTAKKNRVRFWLPKPMIVYSALLRDLAQNEQVELDVVFFGAGRGDLYDDAETGARRVWDERLLKGYDSSWTVDRFGAGFAAGGSFARANPHALSIVAGTQHAFLRGLLAAAWFTRSRVLLRYDATLEARYGSRGRDLLRQLALRVLFSRLFRLGYTSAETRKYLRHYGASESQLWHFPYLIDHDLVRESILATKASGENLRERLGWPLDAIVVIAALKFNDRESPLDLVNAFLRTKNSRLHLVLVGDGPLGPKVKAAARAGSSANRISLPGFLPYAKLLASYTTADIFVHPAHQEVWGVSVNEAMVAGLPVVASDTVGSAREFIVSGQNGLLFPAGDIGRLAEILDSLAGNDSLRRTLAANGNATVEQFSPACWARRIEALASEK